MNGWIGVTDNEWAAFLSRQSGVHEANCWQPGGKTPFGVLKPGEPFLHDRLGEEKGQREEKLDNRITIV